jgi:hypothetical protein
MKFGVTITPDIDLKRTAELAKMTERCGFDSIWSAERAEQRDFLPAMMTMARSTKRIKISLGCSTPILYPARSPNPSYRKRVFNGRITFRAGANGLEALQSAAIGLSQFRHAEKPSSS